jgi:hypothetical protein
MNQKDQDQPYSQKLVLYEQATWLDGSLQSPFLDVNVLVNQSSFSLKPGETVIAVLLGSCYRGMDSQIYQLFQANNKEPFTVSPSHQCLCYVIKNIGVHCVFVGKNCKLKTLIQCPSITTKLCYGSQSELSSLKLQCLNELENEINNIDESETNKMLYLKPYI